MATNIFINLPVKDLKKSSAFFTQLGFTFNPQFTDKAATCMIHMENIFAMLLTYPKFQSFNKKPISDATQNTEVLIALDAESRTAVEHIVSTALAAGGSTYMDPQDHGWMYQHSFADLNGHQWEIVYMDESKLPQQ